MKKTLTTALLCVTTLASTAAATSYTYNAESNGGNGNYNGFYFSLSSLSLTPETGSPSASTLEGSYILNGFTTTCRPSGGGTDKHGLFVLNSVGDTIIGFSTETYTPIPGENNTITYTFTAADGSSPLELDAEKEYRFLAVNDTAWGYANTYASADTTLTLNYGSNSVATGYNAGVISSKLASVGAQMHSQTNEDNKLAVIWNQNGTSRSAHSIALTDVSITPAVPEPATATLSLLALAGLAARRRRK